MHMRGFLIAVVLLAFSALTGRLQAQTTAELQQAMVGSWAGTLEYRDFSEPATSAKRVKLPMWLGIEAAGAGLRFSYIYDDGPAKTVTETSLVKIDPATARYNVLDSSGKLESSYAIAGLAQLQQGRGSLTLTGKGTENQVAVDVRTTIRVGRNILEITRETAAPGQTFTFRHSYTLVRAAPPTTASGK